jgi:hypothetical protein
LSLKFVESVFQEECWIGKLCWSIKCEPIYTRTITQVLKIKFLYDKLYSWAVQINKRAQMHRRRNGRGGGGLSPLYFCKGIIYVIIYIYKLSPST